MQAPWDFAAGAPAAAAELAAPPLRPAGGGGGENLNLAVILALAIVAGLALLALAVLCWRQRRPQSSAMPQARLLGFRAAHAQPYATHTILATPALSFVAHAACCHGARCLPACLPGCRCGSM